MRKIAVDLCNTLFDVNGVLEKMGFSKKPEEYFFENLCPEFFEQNPAVFLKAAPFAFAKECMLFLSRQYEITYLSARPENAYGVTMQALTDGGFPNGNIVFTKNKPLYFKEHNMYFAIDDAPSEIWGYTKNGIPVLIPMQSYNKLFNGPRFSWENLYLFLKNGGEIQIKREPHIFLGTFS